MWFFKYIKAKKRIKQKTLEYILNLNNKLKLLKNTMWKNYCKVYFHLSKSSKIFVSKRREENGRRKNSEYKP